MIERNVGFEFASKRKILQDQLDQLDLEEKKIIHANLVKEKLSDKHFNLIQKEVNEAIEKGHETSEKIFAREMAIKKQTEAGKYNFSYKYPTFTFFLITICVFFPS